MLKFMKNDGYPDDMIVHEDEPNKKTFKENIRGLYMTVDSLLSDIHPTSIFKKNTKNNIRNQIKINELSEKYVAGMLAEIEEYLKYPTRLYKKNIEKTEKTLFALTGKHFEHQNFINETQKIDADAYEINKKILEIHRKILDHISQETREIKHNPMKTFSDLEEPSKKAEKYLKPLLEEIKSCIKQLPGM